LEGQPKNLSIESSRLQQGVFYQAFYKWFASRKKSIIPVDIVGMTEKQPLKEVQKQEDPSCQEPLASLPAKELV